MDKTAFEAALKADGYGDIETKTKAPGEVNSAHSHPYAVRLMVLSGEITVTNTNGPARTCRAGDTFSLAADCEHFERYGAEGAVILAGKKHKS